MGDPAGDLEYRARAVPLGCNLRQGRQFTAIAHVTDRYGHLLEGAMRLALRWAPAALIGRRAGAAIGL